MTGRGVDARFQDDLAGQAADGCRAGGDQRPSQARNRGIARQDNDGATPDLGQFAPPQFAAPGSAPHEEAAAARNESRSPQSSGSSIGCASYAA